MVLFEARGGLEQHFRIRMEWRAEQHVRVCQAHRHLEEGEHTEAGSVPVQGSSANCNHHREFIGCKQRNLM